MMCVGIDIFFKALASQVGQDLLIFIFAPLKSPYNRIVYEYNPHMYIRASTSILTPLIHWNIAAICLLLHYGSIAMTLDFERVK